MTTGNALSIPASNQDPAHPSLPNAGTPQQAFAQGNLINTGGAPVAAAGRNIPIASRTAAAAAVQAMVERIQSNRSTSFATVATRSEYAMLTKVQSYETNTFLSIYS